MTDEELIEEPDAGRGLGKLIVVAIVGIALAAFVVQNTDDTPVSWLMFDESAPLWIVIVISAVAGAILSEAAGWMIRRGRRR